MIVRSFRERIAFAIGRWWAYWPDLRHHRDRRTRIAGYAAAPTATLIGFGIYVLLWPLLIVPFLIAVALSSH
jgi:hypothetical protein